MLNASASKFGLSSGPGHRLDSVDLIVVVVYLCLCLVVGLWAACRTSRGSASGYFLAGREIQWYAVGASIFCVDFGTRAIMGTAGAGAAFGISVACYGLNAIFCVLLQAWVFVPVYIAAGVYTLPEYLKKRFGGRRLQLYMAVLSLILCVFTKLAPDIFAGALFIQQFLGWNMYLGVTVVLAISTVYALMGGLKAAMYTQTLQTGVLLIGCVILSILSFRKVGGMPGLQTQYMMAVPSVRPNHSDCGKPDPEAFHLVNNAVSGAIPWPGNVFGITLMAAWYFCTDQVMVQRSLAAKNMHHVKGGSVLASYFKILPLFIIIFPGMISRVLFPDEVACADPSVCTEVCGNPAGCSNIAFPKLVMEVMPIGMTGLLLVGVMSFSWLQSLHKWLFCKSRERESSTHNIMPVGLKGLMLAGMMAFLMSTLTSVFNSASTIFAIDIWIRLRPRATDAELLVVGRLFVLVMVGISVLWLPVLQTSQQGQLFNYIQSVVSYIAPPVLAVFLLALLWDRTSEPGAFWGLMVGLAAGVCRGVLEFSYPVPRCGESDTRPAVLSRVHFLYFAILLFLVSVLTTVGVSLITTPVDRKHLVRLTWRTRHSTERRLSIEDEDLHSNEDIQLTTMETANEELEEETNETIKSCWHSVLSVICGLEKRSQRTNQKSHLKERMEHFTSIKEDPRRARFVNINAVIVMIITAFLWGHFA